MVPGGAASTGRGGDFLGVLGWGRTGVCLGEQPLRSGARLVHAPLCRLCPPPPPCCRGGYELLSDRAQPSSRVTEAVISPGSAKYPHMRVELVENFFLSVL